jgi:hypothetical protein
MRELGTCNTSTWEAEAGGSQLQDQTWATWQVQACATQQDSVSPNGCEIAFHCGFVVTLLN